MMSCSPTPSDRERPRPKPVHCSYVQAFCSAHQMWSTHVRRPWTYLPSEFGFASLLDNRLSTGGFHTCVQSCQHSRKLLECWGNHTRVVAVETSCEFLTASELLLSVRPHQWCSSQMFYSWKLNYFFRWFLWTVEGRPSSLRSTHLCAHPGASKEKAWSVLRKLTALHLCIHLQRTSGRRSWL